MGGTGGCCRTGNTFQCPAPLSAAFPKPFYSGHSWTRGDWKQIRAPEHRVSSKPLQSRASYLCPGHPARAGPSLPWVLGALVDH